mmetsp:Transcript_107193/g.284202  ORF Transcript_107193/g.284202 Transcript_107193/m.284202 type:complete len:351 (+) Transcript_107193:409-1461(+)
MRMSRSRLAWAIERTKTLVSTDRHMYTDNVATLHGRPSPATDSVRSFEIDPSVEDVVETLADGPSSEACDGAIGQHHQAGLEFGLLGVNGLHAAQDQQRHRRQCAGNAEGEALEFRRIGFAPDGHQDHEAQQGDGAEHHERCEHHQALLRRTLPHVRRQQAQLLHHHVVHEEVLVLGHDRDHPARVFFADALLLVDLHHLLHLALGVVLQLPLLAPPLAQGILHLRLARGVLAEAHGEAVGDEVAEAHDQHLRRREVGADGAGHDREGGDDAVQATEDHGLHHTAVQGLRLVVPGQRSEQLGELGGVVDLAGKLCVAYEASERHDERGCLKNSAVPRALGGGKNLGLQAP